MNNFEIVIKAHFAGEIDKDVFYEKFQCRYEKKIFAFINSLTKGLDLIEDVYQEFLIHFYSKLKNYKLGTNFSAWLFQLAKNLTYSFLRSSPKEAHVRIEDSPERVETSPGPKTISIKIETSQLVKSALDDLDPKYKELLYLAFYVGLTHREIAETTGIGVSSVQRRVAKGINLIGASISNSGIKIP